MLPAQAAHALSVESNLLAYPGSGQSIVPAAVFEAIRASAITGKFFLALPTPQYTEESLAPLKLLGYTVQFMDYGGGALGAKHIQIGW